MTCLFKPPLPGVSYTFGPRMTQTSEVLYQAGTELTSPQNHQKRPRRNQGPSGSLLKGAWVIVLTASAPLLLWGLFHWTLRERFNLSTSNSNYLVKSSCSRLRKGAMLLSSVVWSLISTPTKFSFKLQRERGQGEKTKLYD